MGNIDPSAPATATEATEPPPQPETPAPTEPAELEGPPIDANLPRNEAASTNPTHAGLLEASLNKPADKAPPKAPFDKWNLTAEAQLTFLQLREAKTPKEVETAVNDLLNKHKVPQATVEEVLTTKRSAWGNAWEFLKEGSFRRTSVGDRGQLKTHFHVDLKGLGWETKNHKGEFKFKSDGASAEFHQKADAWKVTAELKAKGTTTTLGAGTVVGKPAKSEHKANVEVQIVAPKEEEAAEEGAEKKPADPADPAKSTKTILKVDYTNTRGADSDAADANLTLTDGENPNVKLNYTATRGKNKHIVSASNNEAPKNRTTSLTYTNKSENTETGGTATLNTGEKQGGGLQVTVNRPGVRVTAGGSGHNTENGTLAKNEGTLNVTVAIPSADGKSNKLVVTTSGGGSRARTPDGTETDSGNANLEVKLPTVRIKTTGSGSTSDGEKQEIAKGDASLTVGIPKGPGEKGEKLTVTTTAKGSETETRSTETEPPKTVLVRGGSVTVATPDTNVNVDVTNTDKIAGEEAETENKVNASASHTITLSAKDKEKLTLSADTQVVTTDKPDGEDTFRAGAKASWTKGKDKSKREVTVGAFGGMDTPAQIAKEGELPADLVAGDKAVGNFGGVDAKVVIDEHEVGAKVVVGSTDETTVASLKAYYNKTNGMKLSLLAGMAEKNDNIGALLRTTNSFVLAKGYDLKVGAQLKLLPGDDGYDKLWHAYAGLGIPLPDKMSLTLTMGLSDDGQQIAYVPEVMFDIPEKLGVHVLGRFGQDIDPTVAAKIEFRKLGLSFYGGYGDPTAVTAPVPGIKGMKTPALDARNVLGDTYGDELSKQGYFMMTSDLVSLFRTLGDL